MRDLAYADVICPMANVINDEAKNRTLVCVTCKVALIVNTSRTEIIKCRIE